MNSLEIVRRTLDFESPERVAISFRDSDFRGAGCSAKTYAIPWNKVSDKRWERTDEWGNVWARVDETSMGEVVKGVLENLSDLDAYKFPDFSRKEDYQAAYDARRNFPDKWLIGFLPGFTFNIARKMRKMEQYLVDLLIEPELIHELNDRIDSMLEDMIRNYADVRVDSVMFAEDWGTQSQTLISPELWKKEFFPRFQKLCSLAHDRGVKVFMHSCGQTEAIVPGLIQAGIDVLQFDQPDLHGIDVLASHQNNAKITFWCPVDIQKTLQKRDEAVIRAKAREMLDKLWKGRGGFIAGYYGDNASIGLDPKFQEYACDEFVKYGVMENFRRFSNG